MSFAEHANTLFRHWRPPRGGREAMRRFQARKLRSIVAHCREHVAVYRDHWRGAAIAPSSIGVPEAIRSLPPIAKDDLRARPLRDTLADGVDPATLVRHDTSGSSGQPFAIHRSLLEEHVLQLFRLRALADAGMRWTDRVVRFRQLPAGGARATWPGRLRRALGIHPDADVDGLAGASEMLDALARQRPGVVAAYPSTLRYVAERALRDHVSMPRPRFVMSGGEVLDASARRTISDAFGAPIVDVYGAHEFNLIAWECPNGHGYHVCDDNVLVEVLDDDDRPVEVGGAGHVVATALHSYTMPFVRYRTGDRAVRGPDACPCGQPYSTLLAIEGRATDVLRLPGGRFVHPYRITGALADHDADWIGQHRLVQVATDHVVLEIAARRTPGPGDLERLRAEGAQALGAGVRFDLALVDGFARGPGRKFRPYVGMGERAAAE
ncbi:phenylacetate-CoA ligase [Burkholderiales bacterium]|nr:phenylacetate-CoA ligase [Burkholderiales bacterium]